MSPRTPLTTGQAARALGVSAQTIRTWALQGKLTFYDTPLGRLYDAGAVEALASQREAIAASATKEKR